MVEQHRPLKTMHRFLDINLLQDVLCSVTQGLDYTASNAVFAQSVQQGLSAMVPSAGLTEGEKEEGVKAKEALNEDGEGSDDEGDTRKAATYGNKKNEVCPCCHSFHRISPIGLASIGVNM